MRLPRLPLLILGIAIVLGLMIWLVSSLLWLYRFGPVYIALTR